MVFQIGKRFLFMTQRYAFSGTVMLAACTSQVSTMPDALRSCGSDQTVTAGVLYSCVVADEEGLCTNDVKGHARCFPICTPQFECALGTPYVLVVANDERVCYCSDDRSL